MVQTKLRLEQIEEIPASEVVNTPAGGIVATDVQSALNELDTEKAGIADAETISADWLFATDKKVQFRDAAIYIHSPVDGTLLMEADEYIDLSGSIRLDTTTGYLEFWDGAGWDTHFYCVAGETLRTNADFFQVADWSIGHYLVGYEDYGEDAVGLYFKKARGTEASPAVVQINDMLGRIHFQGYSVAAGDFHYAAEIRVTVDAEPDTGDDATDMPGRIGFFTTPDGTHTPLERLRIDNVGVIWFNPSAGLDTCLFRDGVDVLASNDNIQIPQGKEFRPGGDANSAFGEDGSGHAYLKDAIIGTKTLTELAVLRPDVPPSSAHVKDDEFNDGALDVKWTWYNEATLTSWDEGATRSEWLFMQHPGEAGDKHAGIYQAIPAGNFTVTVRCGWHGVGINYIAVGLVLMESPPGKIESIVLAWDQALRVRVYRYNSPTNWNATLATLDVGALNEGYLKMERVGNAVSFWYSPDGLHYVRIYYDSDITTFFTPAAVGIYVNCVNAVTPDLEAFFNWFRIIEP